MTTYRMQWETTTVGLPWQYDFEMPSDQMAKDYTQRHTKLISSSQFMAMLLWELESQRLVARFILTHPQAVEYAKQEITT